MKASRSLIVMFAIAALSFTGCSTIPKTEDARANLHDEAKVTLNQFKRAYPGLEDVLKNAHGYAIFPDAGKGGLIVGGAYGRGEVYEHVQLVGYADIRQGSVGATIGGQTFAELIAFQTREAMYKFKNNNFTLGANASAVALKAGTATATEWNDGVAVYTMTKGGLMADASISGQKFVFVPLSEAETGPTTRPSHTETHTETHTTVDDTRDTIR